MTELNQEQHIQLLQFMGLLQNCKTENEMQKLKVEYYDIPKYSFLQDFIPEKEKDENLSSYKTNLIYKMDKYQQDYKFVYGESFPAYKKQTIPENKADYTVSNLLDEISECDNIETYQELLSEKNRFPKVKIEALSSNITGIYFSNGLPGNIVLNSPENNFNARKQLVEAGYSPFTLPSVDDVRENGFDWLQEEISYFKESLNPNFIEQETQMNQEPEFNEQEYEEVYDDFIEQMDANSGMSSMAAEADYNASYENNEDVDEVQRQMDIDNGLIDENGNEILYDGPESEQEENFEVYIHSEEFITKFGDWEKANRLEKLRNAECIIKDGKITLNNSDITETVESLIDNEDRKGLQALEKEIGKNILGAYVNPDTGLTINVSNRNVTEISNHHYLFKEHIQSLSFIPEIIDKAILIGEVENEDKQKHPNIEKYLYFGTGIKIDGVDYTCKSVVGIDKNNNCYYDQSLSTIEKGRLVDYIFKNEKVGNLSPLITQRETDLEGNDLPYIYYDKRLINICQVPQMPYLEKNTITGKWQPTKEAVEAVKNGALFVEKQGQNYIMHNSINDITISNTSHSSTEPIKVEESINNEIMDNNIPVENNESKQQLEKQNESQTYENNNTNIYISRPKNIQELHQFFINNPYTAGTPVPTIAMRNELTGHSTFIEGYEFARIEDIGNENPAFKDENGNQIKPEGQTVVLTKPAFKEVIDEETGEKKLVPDENNRKFIKISRDLYEQVIKNSEIIAKRNPKTKQEKEKMIADYEEAAHLDERKQRDNTAANFWHNYQAGVMTFANNKQEAMKFAKRLVNEMIPSEKKKFARMVKNYEKIKGADGKHLSYDQRILERYEDITKGLQITNKSIWRDHIDKKFDVLDAIKRNTEVFDKEGQPLDKTCLMKIGDTIKMSITIDSALSNKKIKLPPQEFRLVAHSKDSNSVALISADGKQKIIKNREDFIKQVQKIEKKQIKKQQRQDKYESISM